MLLRITFINIQEISISTMHMLYDIKTLLRRITRHTKLQLKDGLYTPPQKKKGGLYLMELFRKAFGYSKELLFSKI